MGKCLNRGEQTGTQRRRTKQQKIGGGSEEKWCNKSLQSEETKPGQKEHLALHTDIREPVALEKGCSVCMSGNGLNLFV